MAKKKVEKFEKQIDLMGDAAPEKSKPVKKSAKKENKSSQIMAKMRKFQ